MVARGAHTAARLRSAAGRSGAGRSHHTPVRSCMLQSADPTQLAAYRKVAASTCGSTTASCSPRSGCGDLGYGSRAHHASSSIPAIGMRQDARKGSLKWMNGSRPPCLDVFAVGDVTGQLTLTPVAIAAGRRMADRTLGWHGSDRKLSYEKRADGGVWSSAIGNCGTHRTCRRARTVRRCRREVLQRQLSCRCITR